MLSITKSHSKLPARFFANPARVIVSSFALLVLLGTLLLMLPVSSRSGQIMPFMDALFTATSASCVTGLIVADTFTQFTIFGQTIILILIQLGGLGLVAFATFFNLAIHRRMGLKSLHLAGESVSSDSMSEAGHLIKMIFAITFLFELVGALLLMTVFVPEYQGFGVFLSIFLAVSAYCNAGFDLCGMIEPYGSLTPYQDNVLVLLVIMGLIICGGLGFIVWQDLYRFRRTRRLALHTKIVLIASGILLLAGAAFFTISEWSNPKTLGGMPVWGKILNGTFMSVSARTAGFNTIPVEGLYGVSKLFMVVLMFIGAAPGGTGGGIKVTTACALLMTVVCVMRGKNDTVIGDRRVDKSVVYKAMAVTFTALLAVGISSGIIYFSTHTGGVTFSEIDALFESVSAFGTVGISCGISGVANTGSRIALLLTMFLGRVGPVSLALSLAMRPQSVGTVLPEAKIMVG